MKVSLNQMGGGSVIVVEGPDESGKTTLAKQLAKEFALDYCRPPTLDSVKGVNPQVLEWWDEQLHLGLWAHISRVYDRCYYISEGIYGPVMHRESDADPARWIRGLELLAALKPVVIFCLPDWSLISNHYKEKGYGLEGLNEEKAKAIYWVYFDAMAKWSMILNHHEEGPVMQYDWSNSSDIFDRCYRYLVKGAWS